jgi:hypothetical protein
MKPVFVVLEVHDDTDQVELRRRLDEVLYGNYGISGVSVIHPYCIECIEAPAETFERLDDKTDALVCMECYGRKK